MSDIRICLCTHVGEDHLRLLPFFLAHYRPLVDRMLVVPQARRDLGAIEACRSVCDAFGAQCLPPWVGPWSLPQWVERRRAILADCSDSTWVVHADADEFHEYSASGTDTSPRTLALRCEAAGRDYVRGDLVDRVAADGGLPELTGNPLEVQFPVKCRITKNILRGSCTKVVLARIGLPVSLGHHHTEGRGRRLPGVSIPVHHYKWDATVLCRLRERREAYKALGLIWWTESDRFLAYIDATGGRLDLTDPRLEVTP